mgnify:CR=1 FL=1
MKRRFHLFSALAACAALISGGCGFQPMYATSGYAGLAGLDIETGETRQDYLVEAALDRFVGGGRSPYRLVLDTQTRELRIGVSAAGRASRYGYTLTTAYLLTGAEGEVLEGEVSETVYFDAPGDPYALIAARGDAEERAADLIARALSRDIAASLQRAATQDAP